MTGVAIVHYEKMDFFHMWKWMLLLFLKCCKNVTVECFLVESYCLLSEEMFLDKFIDGQKTEWVCVKSVTDIYYLLITEFGDKYLSWSNVFIWFNKFFNGRELVNNDLRSGRPPTSMSIENIAKIRYLVCSDHRLTIREIVDELHSSFYAIESILTEELNTHWIPAKFISKLLLNE